ncbi:MAG: hypothetical protein ACNA8W_05905, partial [Bradymonadaceae bacterium]
MSSPHLCLLLAISVSLMACARQTTPDDPPPTSESTVDAMPHEHSDDSLEPTAPRAEAHEFFCGPWMSIGASEHEAYLEKIDEIASH